MAKRQPITDEELLEALGDAVTRAIHWAPESLLVHFDSGRRDAACRRLALRVVCQLAGDGWAEGRSAKGCEGLHAAVALGIARAGDGILTTLSEARRCNGRLLDGISQHIGAVILAAMKETGARLRRREAFAD